MLLPILVTKAASVSTHLRAAITKSEKDNVNKLVDDSWRISNKKRQTRRQIDEFICERGVQAERHGYAF